VPDLAQGARPPAGTPAVDRTGDGNLTDAQIHEALARDAAAQSRPLPANIRSGIVRVVLSRNHMRKIAKKGGANTRRNLPPTSVARSPASRLRHVAQEG
jgi:hypothetical protein